MNLTTFQQEDLPNSQDLIIKSLFILVIKWDMYNTYMNMMLHPEADRLMYLYNVLKPVNHLYISMINPVEYTFIAKNLVQPHNRAGLDKDFNTVDTDLFLAYLHNLNILSTTISVN